MPHCLPAHAACGRARRADARRRIARERGAKAAALARRAHAAVVAAGAAVRPTMPHSRPAHAVAMGNRLTGRALARAGDARLARAAATCRSCSCPCSRCSRRRTSCRRTPSPAGSACSSCCRRSRTAFGTPAPPHVWPFGQGNVAVQSMTPPFTSTPQPFETMPHLPAHAVAAGIGRARRGRAALLGTAEAAHFAVVAAAGLHVAVDGAAATVADDAALGALRRRSSGSSPGSRRRRRPGVVPQWNGSSSRTPRRDRIRRTRRCRHSRHPRRRTPCRRRRLPGKSCDRCRRCRRRCCTRSASRSPQTWPSSQSPH